MVGNTVSDEIKETCHKNYSIFVWDVRNLLWLFDEFQEIKNEFIALLNYTTDKLEPEKPIPLIFSEHKEALENCSWVERLERLKPGREHYQDYQTLCIDILKYVLGDYLTLWNGKLILCLSDKDLLELIDIKDKNEQPTTDFFEAMLDDLLIHLEK